jgi:hypothetical protein
VELKNQKSKLPENKPEIKTVRKQTENRKSFNSSSLSYGRIYYAPGDFTASFFK